ncbi:unnamed protein product [Mytilus coruscus]|uniref:Reverse transcriptase domain-containing protein n=1 Tax=Mytilus coruscus TaxID=42192 RepID=A0A6J8EY06_MYTCO|nr:unnamed protein product [Mytilus coruscus]
MPENEHIAHASSDMSDIERVKIWAASKKINDLTAAELIKLGYDSMEALSLVCPADLTKSKIPIGQQRLVLRAVKATFSMNDANSAGTLPESQPQTETNDVPVDGVPVQTGSNDLYTSEVIKQLQTQQSVPLAELLNATNTNKDVQGHISSLGNSGQTGTNDFDSVNNIVSWKDPQIFLKSSFTDVSIIYHDIVDFVQMHMSGTEGGVRLIHDCSRPAGRAVNDFAGEISKQKFQTIEDAIKLVTPNCYMSKVDLKAAYRSVKISEASQKVAGFRRIFPNGKEYTLFDRKLPFGSKLAPNIFHRLSQAVRRMMSRRGFTTVAYLDDFFICEKTKSRCREGMNLLITLLRALGFSISYSKVVDPCQQLTFLGVEIDSSKMEVRLPSKKLAELKADLADFSKRAHATKKQLQSLAGKLNWASAVVRGGRVFLRRIINSITRLKRDWHKTNLKGDIADDILWWHNFMSTFNGKSLILDRLPLISVATDACRSGAGGFYENDWFYVNWGKDFPFASNLHINELEAAKRWASAWRNKRVIIFCDNAATVNCLNKCTSKNSVLMSYLRELFWLSAKYNFHIKTLHIARKENILADTISRLHVRSMCESFMRFYLPCPLYVHDLKSHMSGNSLDFLLSRVTGLQGESSS